MIKKGLIWKFALAFGLGVLVGKNFVPSYIIIVAFYYLVYLCLNRAYHNDVEGLLTYLPYLVFIEIFERSRYGFIIPYLAVQYLYIGIFLLMIFKHKIRTSPHNSVFILLIVYGLFEILNGLSPRNPLLLRSTLLNSFAMIISVVWASYYSFSVNAYHKVFANIKIASLFLGGIVLVAQFSGEIVYGNFSNTDASNGMAPVQLSGYLAVAACVFFFSMMNDLEKKQRLINIAAFGVIVTIMVMTFSRGGLYFLGAIICLYMLFNPTKLKNYLRIIILAPLALLIYNITVEQTDGAIIERYEEEGSSNRDKLVMAGVNLFLRYPVTGVGTSNFGKYVTEERLFAVESTAHNEFVRAMAEHGFLGLSTYWLFFISMGVIILRRKEPNRQFSLYFLCLFCFILVHNGLKVSVQQLLLILSIGNAGVVANTITFRKNQQTNALVKKQVTYRKFA